MIPHNKFFIKIAFETKCLVSIIKPLNKKIVIRTFIFEVQPYWTNYFKDL